MTTKLYRILKNIRREVKHILRECNPIKRKERAQWIRRDGVAFFRNLGVTEGDTVLDFGCGPGAYTLPLAKLVGESGLVVSIDRKSRERGRLKRAGRAEGLNNILTTPHLSEAITLLQGRQCTTILLFDVLHFMDLTERLKLYGILHGLLQPESALCVHPKHIKGEDPSHHFIDMTLEELIREIESAGFRLLKRQESHLWHAHERQDGVVLTFKKLSAPG